MGYPFITHVLPLLVLLAMVGAGWYFFGPLALALGTVLLIGAMGIAAGQWRSRSYFVVMGALLLLVAAGYALSSYFS
jgi:hypothetical protein